MKYITILLMSISLCFAGGINFKSSDNQSIFLNKNLENYTSINDAILSEDVKDGDVLILKAGEHFDDVINISKSVTLTSNANSTIIAKINIINSVECIFENIKMGLEPEGDLSANLNVESGKLILNGRVELNGTLTNTAEIEISDTCEFVLNNSKLY